MNRSFEKVAFLALIIFLSGIIGGFLIAGESTEGAGSSTKKGPHGEYRYEFFVLGMSCANCAKSAEGVLRDSIKNIINVEVDFATKQAIIESESVINQTQIRDALGSLGFEAQFPGEQPPPKPLTEAEKARLDIETISTGEKVSMANHLASGKLTIFDYYAEWCGPCHLLSPRLEQLVNQRDDVALRVIDISEWGSPAAKQATDDFHMSALPYVRIYDVDGQLLGDVVGNHYEKIITIIKGAEQ